MGALTIKRNETQHIYALAAKLGMVEHGSHEDALHTLVQGLTGKESVKELTPAEAQAVLTELRRRSACGKGRKPRGPRKYTEVPGGVTAAQQRKIWWLMSELERCDIEPNPAPLRQRLCGIIQRQIGVTAFPADPMRFLRREDGSRLIDILKNYAENAERKYLHSDKYQREAMHR